jgi:hypothetical protein
MTIQLGDASANPFLTDVVSQAQAVAALNATVSLQLRGQSSCTIQVTAIGTQTLVFEGSTDGVNFYALTVFPIGGFTGAPISSTTATGQWIVVCAGMYQIRTRCSAYTSGSATVSMVASQGTNEQQVTTGIAQSSVSASQLGQIVMGNVTTAAPAYTTAQSNPLSLTTAGAIRSDINSIIGTTAVAASAGVLKTGVSGATGVTLDAAAPGTIPANAVLVGARAANANPTSATNGQLQAPLCDLSGRLITTPLNYRTLISWTPTTISATGATTIAAAAGANIFRDLCALVITTAGLAAQTITISDGTLSWIIDYPNATLAPGTPFIIQFGDVPLRATTANVAWTANQSVATTCHYLVQYVDRLA